MSKGAVKNEKQGNEKIGEKLAQHREEWNTIYPFVEWLYQRGITLAEWRDAKRMFREEKEAAKKEGKPFRYKNLRQFELWKSHLLEHPVPIFLSQVANLLYEYFGVDATHLEKERREILAELQKKQ